MMVGPTHEMTTDLCLPAFEAACPKELIIRHLQGKRRYDLHGGRTVKYGSADKPQAVEGKNLAAWWGDEARYWPVQSWRNMLARLRDLRARRLQAVLTSTPAMGWLEDEFGSGRPDRRSFTISTRENEHNLAPGYIADLRRSYPPRLARSLIDGEFSVLSGAVYEEFEEQKHAVEWDYDPRFPLWVSWDFGVRAASMLFAQEVGDFGAVTRCGKKLPPRSVVVFSEIQTEELATQWQIPLVKERLVEFGRKAGLPGPAPVWQIVVDPAGNQRSQGNSTTIVEMLQAAFVDGDGRSVVRWETAVDQRNIPNRIARVSGALHPVEGEPTLYFGKGLFRPDASTREGQIAARRGVVKSVRGSTYPEKGGRRTSDRPQENEPNGYEHARDTLEYLVVRQQNDVPRRTSSVRPKLSRI